LFVIDDDPLVRKTVAQLARLTACAGSADLLAGLPGSLPPLVFLLATPAPWPRPAAAARVRRSAAALKPALRRSRSWKQWLAGEPR